MSVHQSAAKTCLAYFPKNYCLEPVFFPRCIQVIACEWAFTIDKQCGLSSPFQVQASMKPDNQHLKYSECITIFDVIYIWAYCFS